MAFTKVVGAGIHTLSNITSHNINSSGIITATKFVGPFDGTSGTFSGNVTIGGNLSVAQTVTYEDVKNVDSVGIGTFREGIFIPDSKEAKFGNTAASPDLKIYSDGTNAIQYAQDTNLYIKGKSVYIQTNNNEASAYFYRNGAVKLHYDGSSLPKFETTSSGVSIGGTTIITSASGGKLGIGTATPDQTLELFKASGTNLVKVSTQANSTVGLEIEKTGSTTQTWRIVDGQTVNGALEFYDVTDSTTRLMIDTAGRILINRTSQHASSSERLSVNGMTSIQLNSTSTAPLYVFNEETTSDGTIQPFMYFSDGVGLRAGIGVQRSTGITVLNGQFGLSFRTGSSGVGGTEKIRITSGGNVNIGTGETTQTARMLNVYGGATRVTQTSGGNTVEVFGHTTSGQSYGLLVNAGSTSGDYCANFRNSGGTALFRIRGDGNIGINESAPSEKLQIDGDILLGGQANSSESNYAIKFEYNNHQFAKIVGDGRDSSGYGDIDFYTSSGSGVSNLTQRMSIRANGYIGIGDFTSVTPDSMLHINGISATAQIRLQRTNAAANNNDYGRIYFESNSNVLTGEISVARESAENNGYMHFDTASGGTLTERLRISSTGVVTVNTASLLDAFKIDYGGGFNLVLDGGGNIKHYRANGSNGGLNLTTALTSGSWGTGGGFIALKPNGVTNGLLVDKDGRVMIGTDSAGVSTGDEFTVATNEHTGITIRSGSSHEGNIFFGDGGNGAAGIIRYEHNNDAMVFKTNSTGLERLRIDSSGKSVFRQDAGATNNGYSIVAELNAKTSGSAAANFGPALYLSHTFGGTNYAGSLITSQTDADVNTTHISFYPRNYGWTEALRITKDGDVLIKDTTNSVYNDTSGGGINFKANGQIVTKKQATSQADPLVWLNDTGQTTNRTIVLAQDGSEKGHIGLNGNNLTIGVSGAHRVQLAPAYGASYPTSRGSLRLGGGNATNGFPLIGYNDGGTRIATHVCTGSFYNTTGMIIIKTTLPKHNTGYTMWSCRITGYAYSTNLGGAIDCVVGCYTGENNYYNPSVTGTYPNAWRDNISFATITTGDHNGHLCIRLGTTSTQQLCEIAVTDFVWGYSSVSDVMAEGWSMVCLTSETGYNTNAVSAIHRSHEIYTDEFQVLGSGTGELLTNRRGRGGTIMGTYQYTQMNQGSGYTHLIRSPSGHTDITDSYADRTWAALITVGVDNTSTIDNSSTYYCRDNVDDNNALQIFHHLGYSGSGDSNRVYMVVDSGRVGWKMNHSGGYRVTVKVQFLAGGKQNGTYPNTTSYTGN